MRPPVKRCSFWNGSESERPHFQTVGTTVAQKLPRRHATAALDDSRRDRRAATHLSTGHLRDGRAWTTSRRNALGSSGTGPQRCVVTLALPKVHAITRSANTAPDDRENCRTL